jgi:hypothetical protein
MVAWQNPREIPPGISHFWHLKSCDGMRWEALKTVRLPSRDSHYSQSGIPIVRPRPCPRPDWSFRSSRFLDWTDHDTPWHDSRTTGLQSINWPAQRLRFQLIKLKIARFSTRSPQRMICSGMWCAATLIPKLDILYPIWSRLRSFVPGLVLEYSARDGPVHHTHAPDETTMLGPKGCSPDGQSGTQQPILANL